MNWLWGNILPFNPLPRIPPKCERNTHSFNEMEVIYHFYSNFEKKQINCEWYNNKIIYFFHFKSPFYKFSNTLKKKVMFYCILFHYLMNFSFHSFKTLKHSVREVFVSRIIYRMRMVYYDNKISSQLLWLC